MIRNDRLERALSQAAQERQRKRNVETEEHETNLDQPDRTAPQQHANPHEPTKRTLERDTCHNLDVLSRSCSKGHHEGMPGKYPRQELARRTHG